jgi:hypothetical protein
MTPLHLLVIGALVWLSGALFAAGWLEVSKSHPPGPELSVWRGQVRWGPYLIWGGIAVATIWAILVVLGEIAGSELWSLTRATYWAH